METLRDVFKLMGDIHQGIAIFGATAEFLSEFDKRAKGIGQAVCEEQQLFPEDAAKLNPDDVVLGTKSSELAVEMDNWFKAYTNEMAPE